MAYTEGLPSSFKFNTLETVDTIFSKILIANLFKDETFKAGITFTDKYNERGGQIYARRLGKTPATIKDATASGGMDLVHTETADSLVLIQKKDAISRSEKCYELVETLRATGKSVDKVQEVIAEFKEGLQIQWTKYLLATPVSSGGVGLGGATRSSNTTIDTALSTLIASILADRQQIRVNGGVADVLIISPEMESLFLANAYTSGNAFVPETNEEILKTGKIGRLYGMNVFASNLLGTGTPSVIPVAGNAPANTDNALICEYIIYDHDTFAIACDILGLRMVNAIDFIGSYAQIEAICGGGVVNPALAIAKIVTVPADSVSLGQTTATVVVGGTVQLTATVLPSYTTDKTVTWASGTEAKATVSSAGLVTGVAAGTSVITVTTSNGKTATCTVTVTVS